MKNMTMFSKLFDTYKKSVISPEFYGELAHKPLKYSLKYYYLVAIFLSVVMTTVLSFYGVPGAYWAVRNIAPAVVESIPDDFALSIKDGIATSANTQPIVIAWPDDEVIRTAASRTKFANFFVIDTRANFTAKIFEDSDAMFVLTKDSFAGAPQGNVEVTAFSGLPDVEVTKNNFSSLIRETQGSFHWVIFGFIFFTFLRLILMFTTELILLLLLAGVFWALLSVRRVGVKLSFRTAYQFAVHASSIGILYYAFVLIYPSAYVPFLASLVALIVLWANVLRNKGKYLQHLKAGHVHHEAHHPAHHAHKA